MGGRGRTGERALLAWLFRKLPGGALRARVWWGFGEAAGGLQGSDSPCSTPQSISPSSGDTEIFLKAACALHCFESPPCPDLAKITSLKLSEVVVVMPIFRMRVAAQERQALWLRTWAHPWPVGCGASQEMGLVTGATVGKKTCFSNGQVLPEMSGAERTLGLAVAPLRESGAGEGLPGYAGSWSRAQSRPFANEQIVRSLQPAPVFTHHDLLFCETSPARKFTPSL